MAESQLAIRMRPSCFDDVIGHDDVVKTLRSTFDLGTVPKALMLVGPPGTGKTTLAYIIARAAQGWDFPADTKPDVLEINAAVVRGIDPMKALIDQTITYPMEGKYRIVILDEAQQLTKEAQNCLLKPMEQESSVTVWVICTTDPAKILPAIRSRCMVYELGGLSKKNVHDLIDLAAQTLGVEAGFPEFEQEVILKKLTSPRSILNALEAHHNGMGAAEAVLGQKHVYPTELHEIAIAVVYGSWTKDAMAWGKVKTRPVKTMLLELEEQFKKTRHPGEKEEPESNEVTLDEDFARRPEAARGLKAIVGAFLKGEVIKHSNLKAAEALQILANSSTHTAADTAIEYPVTIGALFRVNLRMTTK